MRKVTKAALIGFATGTVVFAARLLLRRRTPRPFVRKTEDLTYSAISPQTLAANNLTDLNTADVSDLLRLGLEQETVDRIIENRPFRNKLELVSRRVVTEEVYEIIKEKVAIANANEAVKIA